MNLKWKRSSRCDSGACVEVAYVKSTFSGDSFNCVEVAFRTSSHCDGGDCVEVARDEACDLVLLRDSKHPDGPVLVYSPREWAAICLEATEGRPGCVARLGGDSYAWVGETDDGDRTWLEFTLAEIDAWIAGVRAGEFRTPVPA